LEAQHWPEKPLLVELPVRSGEIIDDLVQLGGELIRNEAFVPLQRVSALEVALDERQQRVEGRTRLPPSRDILDSEDLRSNQDVRQEGSQTRLVAVSHRDERRLPIHDDMHRRGDQEVSFQRQEAQKSS
jgi:hypothetical protein